jgi:hypothetical protein
MDWLQNNFIPRKEPVKCLLILYGHRAYYFDVNIDFAALFFFSESHKPLLVTLRPIIFKSMKTFIIKFYTVRHISILVE